MADRGATGGFLTELAKSKNQPVHLVDVLFDVTPRYLTDAWTDIVWNGHTYTAQGHFLGFSNIEETSELQVSQLTAQLSGVDQSTISEVLAENYLDRQLVIRTALLDPVTMAVIADPVLIFDGRMDGPVIEDSPDEGKCIVSVPATNSWVDFERKSGRHTNHEEQQLFFPGDKFFEFASEVTKDITWGKKT